MRNLPKVTEKKNRRLGRGHGSGRVKTSGRGTKGQKARGKIRAGFEGGQLRLIKRLPFNRGRNRNAGYRLKAVVINVGLLELLPTKTVVTAQTLVKYKMITTEDQTKRIKILGDGELSKTLTVQLPCSHGAVKKIEKAGGSIEQMKKATKTEEPKKAEVKKPTTKTKKTIKK